MLERKPRALPCPASLRLLGAGGEEGLRFTFGRSSTVEDAAQAASRVVEAAESIRAPGTKA